jgi:hypothetical protein
LVHLRSANPARNPLAKSSQRRGLVYDPVSPAYSEPGRYVYRARLLRSRPILMTTMAALFGWAAAVAGERNRLGISAIHRALLWRRSSTPFPRFLGYVLSPLWAGSPRPSTRQVRWRCRISVDARIKFRSNPGMTNQHRVQFTGLAFVQKLGSAVVFVDQRLTSFLTLALYIVLERVGNLLRRSFGSGEAKREGAGR